MTYARRQTRPKPRKSELKKFVAPTAGWIANRALSSPESIEGPGALILDNFFPRATGVTLRRGNTRYATLENETLPVSAMFSYRNGLNERLFAANENVVYDITNIIFATPALIVADDDDVIVTEDGDTFGWASTVGLSVAGGFTGGDWITAQFATTGGVYLIGVNGENDGFLFDGETFYPYITGGISRLNYITETAEFTEGDVVTGGTSTATGTIWRIVDQGTGTGYLLLRDIVGSFVNGEALTDVGGGAAVASGVPFIAAPGITFGQGLTTADMAYVWTYKNRLFFGQNDSMNAWYMVNVDAVGGEADVFPLAGVFTQGGSLLWGSAWSLDSSGDSGLSDQCVFVSTIGEVAVYQGTDPGGGLASWGKVGLYRIGTPLGKRAFLRGGGDLAIATSVGLVPLSKAVSLDVTALNVATVSYKIADAWTEALTLRGTENWVCNLWADGKMAVVSPPNVVGGDEPVLFVSNTETGAWARFTGWHILSMEIFKGRLYFGSGDGKIMTANVSGLDDGLPYSGSVVPLYEDFGSPASAKIGTVARARAKANSKVNDWITLKIDFDESLPPAPDASARVGGNIWDQGIWDQSVWGTATPTVINQDWNSVGGIGYSMSVCYQVTSGSIGPIDVELIDMELMYTTAEMVT